MKNLIILLKYTFSDNSILEIYLSEELPLKITNMYICEKDVSEKEPAHDDNREKII